MASSYTLNGTVLSAAQVAELALSFRTRATSQLSFRQDKLFDDAPAFSYGAAVTLARDGVAIFRGTVDRTNRTGTPASESHDVFVVDAWEALEGTIYQENWNVAELVAGEAVNVPVLFPMAVLGLDDAGTPIDIGAQIKAAVDYAASEGVAIQAGTIEAGHIFWPSEVENMTCAEVIRMSLKAYPDYTPWIDHSTSPPTLNVTAVSAMTTVSIPVDGSGIAESLRVRRCDDLIPQAVRIIYKTANVVDGKVFRDAKIDKWPTAGPNGGPRVLQAVIELAGSQMQFQKSPVQVRALPDDQASAKAYLKKKFPYLAIIPDAAMTVTTWEKTFVPELDPVTGLPLEPQAPPVNPNAIRISGTDVDDLPNELVRGNISDWMRRKVGKIHIGFAVKFSDSGSPTADQIAAMARPLPPGFTVVATNATTKIYTIPSQWETGENAPVGLAKAVYESMVAAHQWEGGFTLADENPGGTRFHGAAVAFSGSADSGLAAMKAPVHSVDIDLGAETVEVGFGPDLKLGPADVLQMQRELRSRPVSWWSSDERSSNKLGSESSPSSKGDTVSPYDVPETTYDIPDPEIEYAWKVVSTVAASGGYDLTFRPGWVREIDPKSGTGADAMIYHIPELSGTPMDDDPAPLVHMAAGDYLYVEFVTDEHGAIDTGTTPVSLKVSAADLKSTHYQPLDGEGAGGTAGDYHVRIGRLVADGDSVRWQPWTNGYIDHVRELWTGENLGTGSEIFKRRSSDDDTYQFRDIHGRFGLTDTQDDDQIELDIDAESIGGGVDIYLAPVVLGTDPLPDEAMKIRSIRGLSYDEATAETISPQIAVTAADGEDAGSAGKLDTVLVRGNGAKGSRFGGTANEIAWQDGLVTSTGDGEESGRGWSGEVLLFDCGDSSAEEGYDPSDPSTWANLLQRIAVRNGLIVGVNETPTARAFHATVQLAYIQSCCFVGDNPLDQR